MTKKTKEVVPDPFLEGILNREGFGKGLERTTNLDRAELIKGDRDAPVYPSAPTGMDA